MLHNKETKRIITDISVEIIGSLLIGFAMYNFALNAEFPMTGFSGIAFILYRLFNIPIGLATILLNIPVAILCYRLIGRGFLLRSLRCIMISSFIIDYIAPLFPVYNGDRMLAALVTGTLGGLGYAIIYMRNSSTGGSDFLIMSAKALKPHLKLGTIAFLSDIGIILIGGIIFKDMDGIIYGMIINLLFAVAVDKVVGSLNSNKTALIVTTHGEEVCDLIDNCCGRGSTILDGRGGYRKDDKQVVMVACSPKQLFDIQKEIKQLDKDVFIIVMDANEIHGEDFYVFG